MKAGSRSSTCLVLCVCAATWFVGGAAALGDTVTKVGDTITLVSANGSLFDPYTEGLLSFGSQTFSSGTLRFDTDNVRYSTDDGSSWTYLTDGSQNIKQYGRSANEYVELGFFVFDELDIGSVTVTVTGARGLALVSRGGLTLNTTIDVTGQTITGNTGGDGGPGGHQNALGLPAYNDTGGDGGNQGTDGVGPGRGDGFFGLAGAGSYGGTGAGSQAGVGEYGTRQLTTLYGGSGGGGGKTGSGGAAGSGAGGSIELLSMATLTLESSARLYANGGCACAAGTTYNGGGGSGGGIILAAASEFFLNSDARIQAKGGNSARGRGAGGGRVAFYCDTLTYSGTYNSGVTLGDGSVADVPSVVSISGGVAGEGDGNGEIGTWYQAECPVEPPPPAGTMIVID